MTVAWVNLSILVGCTVVLGLALHRKYSRSAALLFVWIVVSALRVFLAPTSPFQDQGKEWTALLDGAAAAGLAQFLLVLGAGLFAPQLFLELLFRVVALVNACMIIWLSFNPSVTPYGILLQASMSGCFAACLIPLQGMDRRLRDFWPTMILSITAILLTKQSLPMACLMVLFGLYFLLQKNYRYFAAEVVLGLLVAYAIAGKFLFNTSGRAEMWWKALTTWSARAPFEGLGTGTFTVLGPALSDPKNIFIQLHSDWLQVLFEQGIVGLILAVWLYLDLLKRAKKSLPLLLMLGTYGAFMCANMPWHYPLSALFGVYLIRLAFLEPEPLV